MKIEHKVNTVTTNAAFDRREKMGLDEASLNHIFRVLTDIYSDPAGSVVREYAANGYDSHVLAGQTRPVEVTFPTALNSSFIVRDFGVGMSRDDLVNVYRKYGASTKRDTNDQIGAFGLGAKSALALTNSFTVNSVKDGKQNVVIISKDEEGGSDISFLKEKVVDEPDGVIVTIPAPNSREFDRVLAQNIFIGWKPGSVLVNGKQPESIYNAEVYRELEGSGWFEFGERVISRNNMDALRAVVGPVLYKVPSNITNEILKEFPSIPAQTLVQRLVLNLPNGSVAITPNREELIFNGATKRAISASLKIAVEKISEWAATVIEDADSRPAAVKAADRLFAQGLLKPGIVAWRGEAFAKAVATKNYYGTPGVNYDWTFANSEIDLAATEDEGRFFEAKVYWGYSDVNGDHIRTKHEKEAFKVLGRGERYIIITEAKRDKRGYFESNSKITAWAKADGFNNGGTQVKTTILTTTRKADSLDPFLKEMALKVVTAEQVITAAKANPQPTKPRGPKVVTVGTLAVTRIGGAHDKSEMLVNTKPEDLNTTVNYIVAQASGAGGEGERTVENAIYSYFRAPNNGYVFGNTDSIVRLLASHNYSIVVLPSTSNRDKVEAALPNVHTLDEAVASVISFTGTEAEKDYFRHVAGNVTNRWSWKTTLDTSALVKGKDNDSLEKIKNDVTREFIDLTANRSTRSQEITEVARTTCLTVIPGAENFGKCGPLTKAAIAELKVLRERKARTYPLLENGVPEGAESDAVDYINRTDKKAKR